MTESDARPITLRPSGSGCFRVEYDELGETLDEVMPRLNESPRQFKEVAGAEAVHVRFGFKGWAGPHDVYLAITEGMTAVGVLTGGVGALTGGVAALLNSFVKKHPERPINIVFNDESIFQLTGEPMPDEIERRINELAAENSTPPVEAMPKSANPGAPPNIGPDKWEGFAGDDDSVEERDSLSR